MWAGYTDLKGQGWDSKCETNEKDFHLSLPPKENEKYHRTKKTEKAANVKKKKRKCGSMQAFIL